MKGKVRIREPNEITKERLVPCCRPIRARPQVSKEDNTLLISLGSGPYPDEVDARPKGLSSFRKAGKRC